MSIIWTDGGFEKREGSRILEAISGALSRECPNCGVRHRLNLDVVEKRICTVTDSLSAIWELQTAAEPRRALVRRHS